MHELKIRQQIIILEKLKVFSYHKKHVWWYFHFIKKLCMYTGQVSDRDAWQVLAGTYIHDIGQAKHIYTRWELGESGSGDPGGQGQRIDRQMCFSYRNRNKATQVIGGRRKSEADATTPSCMHCLPASFLLICPFPINQRIAAALTLHHPSVTPSN